MPDTFCGHKTSNCWWWQRKWDKKRRKYFRSNLCHFWQVTQQDLYKKVHDIPLFCQTSLLEVEGNPFLPSRDTPSTFPPPPHTFPSLPPSDACPSSLCLPSASSPARSACACQRLLHLQHQWQEEKRGCNWWGKWWIMLTAVMMMLMLLPVKWWWWRPIYNNSKNHQTNKSRPAGLPVCCAARGGARLCSMWHRSGIFLEKQCFSSASEKSIAFKHSFNWLGWGACEQNTFLQKHCWSCIYAFLKLVRLRDSPGTRWRDARFVDFLQMWLIAVAIRSISDRSCFFEASVWL